MKNDDSKIANNIVKLNEGRRVYTPAVLQTKNNLPDQLNIEFKNMVDDENNDNEKIIKSKDKIIQENIPTEVNPWLTQDNNANQNVIRSSKIFVVDESSSKQTILLFHSVHEKADLSVFYTVFCVHLM